jgi:hypothetical protein
MIGLYIYQVISYFMSRLTATRMLWIQVYASLFMTFLGAPIMPSSNFWSISDLIGWIFVFAVL